MHIQHSTTAPADVRVEVSEPWSDPEGRVYGPDVQVWPLGQGSGVFWSLSLDEAQTLAQRLLDGVSQARELFPG